VASVCTATLLRYHKSAMTQYPQRHIALSLCYDATAGGGQGATWPTTLCAEATATSLSTS